KMKLWKMLFILMLFTSLFSQFNEPIQVNEDLNDVFYRGNRACKVIDDEVFMTFVETYSDNIYFAHSPNGEDFTYTLVDVGIPYFDMRNNTQPCLEVLPTGEIVIFYLKENNTTILSKAISNDGGQTFACDSLLIDITAFSSTTVDDKIYLSYQQGSSVALTNYQHFTDIEKSENEDGGFEAGLVKFWGTDALWGPVHSNDDIWIAQIGGGNNNGWPTFHEIVTTAKLLRKFPGGEHLEETGAPMAQIFRGGWAEGEDGDGIDPIIYNPTADLIRENGFWIGDETADIVYVKINGSSFEYMNGDIILSDVEEFNVYSWFPHNADVAQAVIAAGGNLSILIMFLFMILCGHTGVQFFLITCRYL
ncbi:MAG: hypothetical protein K8R49_01175, partial [Candidatus Cloacimonetes bacterium]|nr:hypothetical protein [Candidatus Cloacimonadota bacterium]